MVLVGSWKGLGEVLEEVQGLHLCAFYLVEWFWITISLYYFFPPLLVFYMTSLLYVVTGCFWYCIILNLVTMK